MYDRGPDGLPARWIAIMRRAIQTIAPRFSARRMVKDYIAQLYRPGWDEAAGQGVEVGVVTGTPPPIE